MPRSGVSWAQDQREAAGDPGLGASQPGESQAGASQPGESLQGESQLGDALPGEAVPTEPVSARRSHDWRSPGFPAVVGGRLYDAACVPLHSIGSNAPNLPFRAGLRETLEWLRGSQIRWVRVFATGHASGVSWTPRTADEATVALRRLLDEVQTFNNANPPDRAIYVLVSLTDYYPTGVPGDRHAYDHPTFRDVPVLPAPWYRAGTRSFNFEQEHGYPPLRGMPNYEVYYKPWVQQIVAGLADHRALLGWQFGNELKARNSPRNEITPSQAYEWYLEFARDMTDTIRALDPNHLIFMGAQYIAELVDWDYRDVRAPDPELLPTYYRIAQQALDACGSACWNVWGLTSYDGNPYPLDDAVVFGRAGIATVITEFGFTREVFGDSQVRFGGDRAAAITSGIAMPWVDVDGRLLPRVWSVPELFGEAEIAGVAPWGSAPRTAQAELDADIGRGITYAPDEVDLWAAWQAVATRREASNRSAGPSAACLSLDSRAAS